MESQYYSCITDFRNKEKGEVVFLGDNPDARTSNLTRRLTLAANHPSQRRNQFPAGYLKFNEMRDQYFCLKNQWFRTGRSRYWGAEPVRSYLFENNYLIRNIYEKQVTALELSKRFSSFGEKDKIAGSELVFELATGRGKTFSVRKAPQIFEAFLPELSLPELNHLLGCFSVPIAVQV